MEADLQLHWSDDTTAQLSEAQAVLSTMLNRQECMLREKARVKWLTEGDRNSAFFHATLKDRQARQTQFAAE